MGIAAINSESKRAFATVIVVAATLPVAALLVSFLVFPLLFVVEAIVMGAYPFLATFRNEATGELSSFIFPFNWLLTVLQWVLIAMGFAKRSSGNSIGDQIILSCGLWIATNLVVRLMLLLSGIGIVTTPVRM
jgi:hypothetical protein